MIRPTREVINCAHRGASGSAPENTLASIEQAINLGADMAEIDVQPTCDGMLAVFHDDVLERTSNGCGLLRERTMSELGRLDAGSWYGPEWTGQPIPELGEVLDLVRGRLRLNIEMKGDAWTGRDLDELVRRLREHDGTLPCQVTSFDNSLIDELRLKAPELRIGYILGPGEVPSWAFHARVDLLSAERSLVDAAFLEFAVAAGKDVHVWTVDDPAEMARLIALGVDGIITNHPERFPRRQT